MKDSNQVVPLLIIDVQKAFTDPSWGRRNNIQAEENILRLLKAWRETNRPVIFIQHITQREQSLFYNEKESSQFMDFLNPRKDELIIQKNVNSAFIGTDLAEQLVEMKCSSVVITGLTTNHCVETTTRMAGNMGFNPILVADATATFDRIGPDGKVYRAEDIHQMTLVNLHEEFATILTTDEVINKMW